MENLDVRLLVSENHIRYNDIAKKMGISPVWLSTQLRYELSLVTKERIIQAIEELKNDKCCC